jgi:hypothetical protein
MGRYLFAASMAVCLLTILARGQATAAAAAEAPPRNTPYSNILPQDLQLRGTVQAMFATLLGEAGLPGGAAFSNEACSHGLERSLSIPAGTGLEVALEQVAKSSNMSLQFQNGVVDMLPTGALPPLLQVQIRRFEWDRGAPVREVLDRLRQLPEVSEGAHKLGLREAPLEGGAISVCIRGDCGQKPRPVKALESEEDATLLAVLNRIVQAHGHAVWSYSEYHCNKGTLFSLSVLGE